MIDEKFIAERIAILRTNMNISARDMSLSLGQSSNYINNIENKRALPSMQMFLYICEFLKIEPKDFFNEDSNISILSIDEQKLLKNYQKLPRKKADILLKLSDILKE